MNTTQAQAMLATIKHRQAEAQRVASGSLTPAIIDQALRDMHWLIQMVELALPSLEIQPALPKGRYLKVAFS